MTNWTRCFSPIAIVCFLPAAGYSTQYVTVEQAQKNCFPTASKFDFSPVVFTAEQIASIEEKSGQKVRSKGEQIWKAIDGEKTIGYFIVDYVIGKHLVIDYAVALRPDGSVKQVEILEYRESYGGEIRNPEWLKQFVGKTKDSPLDLNGEISNIGGATLSSRHVTEGIKRVLVLFDAVAK